MVVQLKSGPLVGWSIRTTHRVVQERLLQIDRKWYTQVVGARRSGVGRGEIALNNRPLIYLEDDVQQPVLTPSSMLQINPTYILESEAHHLADKDLKKRAKFLQECKRVMWNRWSREYVRSLRERHRRAGGKQTPHPKIGEVVIIREEKKPLEISCGKATYHGERWHCTGSNIKDRKG